MLGIPGSGKSYFSSRLASDLPAVWLNSDAVRAAMFENPTDIADPKLRYDAVFGAIDHMAEAVLGTGTSVIYDANNHWLRTRQKHYDLAEKVDAQAVLVHIKVPEEVSDERAINRAHQGHQIKMTPEKLKRHKRSIELPRPHEPLIEIDGELEYKEQLLSFKEQLARL